MNMCLAVCVLLKRHEKSIIDSTDLSGSVKSPSKYGRLGPGGVAEDT